MTEMKAGVWKRRDGRTVKARPFKGGWGWIGSDGVHNWDDGQFLKGVEEHELDLVEYLGEATSPDTQPSQPQPDAADELAELRDDRDRWQARARQAEGRVATLTQDLIKADEQVNELQQQLTVATADRNTFRADANRARDQLEIARQQLQDRDAADQVPGNEQLRQQVTQLIAEREGLRRQLQMMERQIIGLSNTLADKQRRLDHAEQQRSILLETSQDQLGQIRMAERIVSLMADKVAQLAVEGA